MEIETLSRKIDHLNEETVKIKEALLGGEFNKNKGMVQVQQEHSDRIQKLEAVKNADHEMRIAKLERYVVVLIATASTMAVIVGINIARYITGIVTAYVTNK